MRETKCKCSHINVPKDFIGCRLGNKLGDYEQHKYSFIFGLCYINNEYYGRVISRNSKFIVVRVKSKNKFLNGTLVSFNLYKF